MAEIREFLVLATICNPSDNGNHLNSTFLIKISLGYSAHGAIQFQLLTSNYPCDHKLIFHNTRFEAILIGEENVFLIRFHHPISRFIFFLPFYKRDSSHLFPQGFKLARRIYFYKWFFFHCCTIIINLARIRRQREKWNLFSTPDASKPIFQSLQN